MIKVGDKVTWNDPAIEEYPEEERYAALCRTFEVVKIKGDVILISDGVTEAEVTENELIPQT